MFNKARDISKSDSRWKTVNFASDTLIQKLISIQIIVERARTLRVHDMLALTTLCSVFHLLQICCKIYSVISQLNDTRSIEL
jgi:hypothetical protein